MKLPTWEECHEAVVDDEPTPLEIFINEHEPSDSVSEQVFRDQLQALIDYVAEELRKSNDKMLDPILDQALKDQQDAERYMHLKRILIDKTISAKFHGASPDDINACLDELIRSYS